MTPTAFNVRNNIKIVEGRKFTPGLYEVIVGKKIADRVSGLDIGVDHQHPAQELEGGGPVHRRWQLVRERDLGRL